MESSDQSKGSKTFNEVMYRRLKNRERQRRYRERKRLRNASKARVTDQSSQLQNVPLTIINETADQIVTRVHCKRDWKKDARRANAAKQEALHAVLSSHSQSSAHQTLKTETEQTKNSEIPSSNGHDHEQGRSKPGRRDWKAEARNKNSRSS